MLEEISVGEKLFRSKHGKVNLVQMTGLLRQEQTTTYPRLMLLLMEQLPQETGQQSGLMMVTVLLIVTVIPNITLKQ